MKRYAIDTGPLVALLNASDAHHDWARQTLDALRPPLFTCEAVLSEAAFLARAGRGRGADVVSLLERGALRVAFRVQEEAAPLQRLMEKYADVPMSLADACLVRMTELDPSLTVITVDHDFRVYRRNGRQAIRALLP